MKVESFAECSSWSILQYVWPALRDNWSWKPILVFLRVAILERFYCILHEASWHDKSFVQSETKTSLLRYRDLRENWNFARSKLRYDTFQKANNKGADQSVGMRWLVCAFVCKPPKTGFLVSRPIYFTENEKQMCWPDCIHATFIKICIIWALTW